MDDGFFAITHLHRNDLELLGFDGSAVTDAQMERICSKMANDYVEQMYWESLRHFAEDVLEQKPTGNEDE